MTSDTRDTAADGTTLNEATQDEATQGAATLGGRYRLVDRIAVGGMGEVWAARDLLLDRDVAVKLLKAEYLENPGFLARFRAEARHTAGLSHPGIASVYDYGEVNEAPYLVMELVQGEPLSAVLARTGALSIPQALDIAAQTARALGAAHAAGVVHRDVKPGNIMVRPDGVVKVTDFGIARAIDGVPLTQTGTVVGTATYLSPEQAQGRPTLATSDLYSLGVVTYEMVAGFRPFAAENAVAVALAHLQDAPEPLPADVPEPVRSLIEQALEKDPAARHPDASAFAEAAEHAAAVTAGLLPPGALPASTSVPAAAREHVGERTRVLRTVAAGVPAGLRAHRRPFSLVAGALAILLLIIVAADAMSDDTKRAGAAAPTASSAPSATAPTSTRPSSIAPSSSAPAPSPKVAIPAKLIGMSYADAAAAVTRLGLRPARRDAAHSSPPGTVYGTDPRFGTPVERGTTVTLVTSSGPAAAVAPEDDEDDEDDEPGRGKKKGRDKDD